MQHAPLCTIMQHAPLCTIMQHAPQASGDASDGSLLAGRTVVVLGAGGAGRALAFGAAQRGAKVRLAAYRPKTANHHASHRIAQVVVANRNRARSEALVAEMGQGATVVDWEAVQEGRVQGDVLANTTSVGMAPNDDATPVPASALGGFQASALWLLYRAHMTAP